MNLLSALNPVPSFPPYTGPYSVGTVDVELAADTLPSPVKAPDPRITTIAFRLYYPCEPDAPAGRPVRWIPKPQRPYIASTVQRIGAGPEISNLCSYLLPALYYVNIPARRNAPLLPPPSSSSSSRWPVVVFSHGMTATRNGYSHLLGSLASHGLVVFAPCHRDGTAPVAVLRPTPAGAPARGVPFRVIPHEENPACFAARNAQLRIRLWELGLVHAAMRALDRGGSSRPPLQNLDAKDGGDAALAMFARRLDVHAPGAVAWAGHSFGAATVVQLMKSAFYARRAPAPSLFDDDDAAAGEDDGRVRLFVPPANAQLVAQITPRSPVALLDPWILPLVSPSTRWLWELPMPCYAPGGPGGTALLAVLSELFYKWTAQLRQTKQLLSSDPSFPPPSSASASSWNGADGNHGRSGWRQVPPRQPPPPRFFYMINSAHPSQSDFALIFPRTTRALWNGHEPARLLRLNVRAILQLLRDAGTAVADWAGDEDEDGRGEGPMAAEGCVKDDLRIWAADGEIRGWVALSTELARATVGEEQRGELANEAVVEGEGGHGGAREMKL